MATVPVRFNFNYGKRIILKYTRPIPTSLVKARPKDAQNNSHHQQIFSLSSNAHRSLTPSRRARRQQAQILRLQRPKISSQSFTNVVPTRSIRPLHLRYRRPDMQEGECEIEARQQVRAMTAEMHVKVGGL
jgi:hypothetical protein